MSKKRTNYMYRADVLFSQLVRARGYCESDRPTHSGNLQCAHIIGRGYKSIRTNELNALCLCQGCHLFYTHRPLEFRQWIEAQYPGRWDQLTTEALRYERVDWKSEVARLSVPLVHPGRTMRVLITDKPDPNCERCHGQGVVGGCEGRHTPNPAHTHTISFCSCTNERYEDRPDTEVEE